MEPFRVALANIPYPSDPENSIRLAEDAIRQAAQFGVAVLCFPECYVPGYRGLGHHVPPPDGIFLEQAWTRIAAAAQEGRMGVILGTERLVAGKLLATALVINADGDRVGFQDKVQVDPSEDGLYTPGSSRQVFQIGGLTFGIAICHEGWRYPETVRWAVKNGARVVFHPHLSEPEQGSYRPLSFADPANSFHEKAVFCRAAENTCYFASVNYAVDGSPTTSAVADPEGALVAFQPYGKAGLLVVDLDLSKATGFLASRCRSVGS